MVLPKPKLNLSFKNKIPLLPKPGYERLSAADVEPARRYIAKYWPRLTRFHPKDKDSLIGLPKPYLVPAHELDHEFDFNELYYWDSYFMAQGLLDDSHKELVTGILDDLLNLFERFGIVPNASRTYMTSRSNPPLLSSFILDVYKAYKPEKDWLKQAIKVAQQEYKTVWMGTQKPNARQVYEGLSRYYDLNYLQDIAEAESGWDYTPRFSHKALDFLPVDLNSLLYKYEKDFAYVDKLLDRQKTAHEWDRAAHQRQITMNRLMWSDLRGLYYDYNYVKEKRGSVSSLAAYYPMWAGLASQKQAERLVNSLKKFENKGGLATTDAPQVERLIPGAFPTQWAYPNGWAPLHFIVIKGLQNYGYNDDARRIALKWLKTNLDWFNKHGVFLEKYNVVQPGKPPAKGVYPSQTGFGWTNSVFEVFCREFIDIPTPH
ncbi:alpha,alpha-trehalase [Candidatus Saccharibacteria bacterium]|nr:alpha,alpha-trehalase [Candidatus Saccharibacteria bacterium]